jgi:hypothetical protein
VEAFTPVEYTFSTLALMFICGMYNCIVAELTALQMHFMFAQNRNLFVLYFTKLSSYEQMFQIKVADINIRYVLCSYSDNSWMTIYFWQSIWSFKFDLPYTNQNWIWQAFGAVPTV